MEQMVASIWSNWMLKYEGTDAWIESKLMLEYGAIGWLNKEQIWSEFAA